MVQRVATVAFEGIDARAVDVQVQVAPGLPAFNLAVGQCQKLQSKVSLGVARSLAREHRIAEKWAGWEADLERSRKTQASRWP